MRAATSTQPKNSASNKFREGHDFSRAVKSLKMCLRFSA